MEIFDISLDLRNLKSDYELIVGKIINGKAHEIRQGDTKFLAAKRLGETVIINDRKVNKREFVLKKSYLQKILKEMKLNY